MIAACYSIVSFAFMHVQKRFQLPLQRFPLYCRRLYDHVDRVYLLQNQMANEHEHNFLSKMAALHLNADYSDLVLRCDGLEFPLHQALVCSLSPVIRNECKDNRFKEGETGVIEHQEYDSDTVRRMVSYIYTQDYNVEDEPPHGSSVPDETASNTNTQLVAYVRVYAIGTFYDISTLSACAL